MMWLLAELYHNLPEAGDLAKPKLAFFFDEAHLLFDDASKAFLDQVQQVVRLIRSKGVGVYFVTQTPKDVPSDVLAQLHRAARAPRPHSRRRHRAPRHRPDLSQDRLLRSRGDADLARHRRGGRDRARRPRRADAGSGHPAHSAVLADGAPDARRAAGRHPPVGPARRVRPGGGPRERAGDAGRAHGAHPGTGARGARSRPRHAGATRAERTRRQTVAQVAGGALVGALSSTIGRTSAGRSSAASSASSAPSRRATTTRRSRW